MSGANASRWNAKLAALDANLLVALDALLSEGSVTGAARRMGITQSAMSQTLGRLRTQFDDPIFVRVGRKMEPTPFARRIQSRLRQAIAELEAVVHDHPDFDPQTTARRMVLAMADYLALVLAPPLREVIARTAPAVDLAIHALDADPIVTELEEGVVDLYVGVRGETERGLDTELLHRESFAVLVRQDHPLLQDPSADTYARAAHVHVSPRREGGSIVDRALEAQGLERRIAVEVPYFSLVPELLRDVSRRDTTP
jgi:DNA-binding transcriptional LysR family regulator